MSERAQTSLYSQLIDRLRLLRAFIQANDDATPFRSCERMLHEMETLAKQVGVTRPPVRLTRGAPWDVAFDKWVRKKCRHTIAGLPQVQIEPTADGARWITICKRHGFGSHSFDLDCAPSTLTALARRESLAVLSEWISVLEAPEFQTRATTQNDSESNSAPPRQAGGPGGGGDMKHSADFASVTWGTERFTFNTRQAACVCVMWEAFDNDTPMMSQDYIIENAKDKYLEVVGTDAKELEGLERSPRLRDVFKAKGKTHHAWQTMIIGDGKGNFGIRPPDNPTDSQNTPT